MPQDGERQVDEKRDAYYREKIEKIDDTHSLVVEESPFGKVYAAAVVRTQEEYKEAVDTRVKEEGCEVDESDAKAVEGIRERN